MKPKPFTKVIAGVYGLLVAAFLVVPTLTVVPMAFSDSRFLEFPPPGYSFRWFQAFVNDPAWMSALTRSLIVAAITAVIAVPIGTLAAYALVRSSQRSSRVFEPLLLAPMMVPIVIFGFALYIGTLILGLGQSLIVVVIAHVILALPFVVVTVSAALRTFDFQLVRAARVAGATAFQAMIRIVVPIIFPAIGAATLIALMISLDEAVVAMFVAGDFSPTLPVKMFGSIQYELNPVVPVAATMLTLVTIVLMITSFSLVRITRRRTLEGSKK